MPPQQAERLAHGIGKFLSFGAHGSLLKLGNSLSDGTFGHLARYRGAFGPCKRRRHPQSPATLPSRAGTQYTLRPALSPRGLSIIWSGGANVPLSLVKPMTE